jgi:hypothetical protein
MSVFAFCPELLAFFVSVISDVFNMGKYMVFSSKCFTCVCYEGV